MNRSGTCTKFFIAATVRGEIPLRNQVSASTVACGIAYLVNVHMMRKATIAERTPAVAMSESAPRDDVRPQPAPVSTEDITRTRVARIANALSTRPRG